MAKSSKGKGNSSGRADVLKIPGTVALTFTGFLPTLEGMTVPISKSPGAATLIATGRAPVAQVSIPVQNYVTGLGGGLQRLNKSQLFSDLLASTPTVWGPTVSQDAQYVTLGRASLADPKMPNLWGEQGPSYLRVEQYSLWAWVNAYGDWINTAGTPQGTSNPHFTFAANSVTSGSYTYTTSILAGVTAALNRSKWNAFIVKSTSSRAIVGMRHPTLAAPYVAVTYFDGSTANLACVACVRLVGGTSYTYMGTSDVAILGNVALEFEMPAKGVSAATLHITIDQHTATAATISGYLANPPVNEEEVTYGLAADYPLDVDISDHPDVLFAQNYVDGTVLSDYVGGTLPDVWAASNWDPGLWGGTDDTTKLPTAASGVAVGGVNKWFHKQYINKTSLVDSSYTDDGFVPASPGQGALRVINTKSTAVDGAVVGYGGADGNDLWALFPKAISGLADDVYVRYRFRYHSIPQLLADTKMFRKDAINPPAGTAYYAIATGKCGIGVQHWTKWGGNNNSGGDNLGWSNRGGFYEQPADLPIAGTYFYVHSWDNIGYNFKFGEGGQGVALYPDQWYTIEIRCKLNTYLGGAIGDSPSDGVMQIWVDGKLCATHTNWKYRDGAVDNNSWLPTFRPPYRDIGAIGLCMNHYNGGVLPSDHDFIFFYSNVVCATSYIGPVDETPAWAAAVPADTFTTLENTDFHTWAYGGGIPAGAYLGNSPFDSLVNAFCDPAFDGVAQYFYGGGHGDGTCNAVVKFDFHTLQYSLVGEPTPPSVYLPGYPSQNSLYYPSGVQFTDGASAVAPWSGFFLTSNELTDPADQQYAAPALARVSTHMYSAAAKRGSVIYYFYLAYGEFDVATGEWSHREVDIGGQVYGFNSQLGSKPLQWGTSAIYDDATDRFYVTLNPGSYNYNRNGIIVFNPITRLIETIYTAGTYGPVSDASNVCKVGRDLYVFNKITGTPLVMNQGFIFNMDRRDFKAFVLTGATEGSNFTDSSTQNTIPSFYDGRYIWRYNYQPYSSRFYFVNLTPTDGDGTPADPYQLTQSYRTLSGTAPTGIKLTYSRLVYHEPSKCALFIPQATADFVAIKLS